MDIMVVIILTSSRPKSNVCIHYVQCVLTKIRVDSFGAIQEDLVPVDCIIVYRDRRYCYSCFIVAGDINSP
jgi:hypothetical protein